MEAAKNDVAEAEEKLAEAEEKLAKVEEKLAAADKKVSESLKERKERKDLEIHSEWLKEIEERILFDKQCRKNAQHRLESAQRRLESAQQGLKSAQLSLDAHLEVQNRLILTGRYFQSKLSNNMV